MPPDRLHYAAIRRSQTGWTFRILQTVANLPLFGVSALLLLQKAPRCGKILKESPANPGQIIPPTVRFGRR
jgi:hypothetical protein